MRTALLLLLQLPWLIVASYCAWRLWCLHRHHRRFMRACADFDHALDAMKKSQTREQLELHAARVDELLEHLDALRKP